MKSYQYHIQNAKQKEWLVLIIYVIYTIGIAAMSYMQKWNHLITWLAIAGMLASIFLHIRHYKDYFFRVCFTACMIWFNCVIYACHSSNILGIFLTVCCTSVLVGVYGIRELSYLSVFGLIFLMAYHVPDIAREFSALASGERITIMLQPISVFLTIYIVHYMVKQQEESNASLIETIESLKKAQHGKNDFMANISHEIRTPINTICGISEVVMRDRSIPDRIHRDILDIQTAGRHLLSTINDILDFSELEMGKMELAEEPYNITSTVNDVMNMAISKNSEKKLEIIVDCDASIPKTLLGDEQKIRRVITNIVDNAIKFTSEGGIMISVSSREEAYGINLLVSVSDTGIGIREDDLESIFTSFTQADAKRSRREGGIGLGLAISQAIVEKMGGFITVKSVSGKGSTVQFVIPQKVLDPAPIVSVKNPEKMRVLGYINMEKYNFAMLREGYAATVHRIVEKLGFYFIRCRTLAELKRRVEKERFTHIFMSFEEYCEDKKYFDELSLRHTVVLVLDREDMEAEAPGGSIVILYKPFYVLPVAAVLNEEDIIQNTDGSRYRGRQFIAPDAKVLIVDDSPMNLRVMEGLLRPYQIKVFAAESGKEALKKIEYKDFDFVFMDHMMPEMDGVDVLRRIRQMPGQYFKSVPVIALTANAIGGAREMFLAEGFADFLAKPVETSVLERVLRRHIPKDKQLKINGAREQAGQKEPPAEAEDKGKAQKSPEISLDGIDTAMGIGFCGGNTDDYMDVLKIYYNSGSAKRREIKKAYEEKDWKAYTIHAHSIKSMSMGIGAPYLSGMAKELEAAGRKEDEEYINAHNGEMLAEYGKILGIIGKSAAIFPKKTDADEAAQELPGIAKEQLLAELEALGEKLGTFEPDGVHEALNRLFEYQFEGMPLAGILSGIKEKADSFDFMGAEEETKVLREKMR